MSREEEVEDMLAVVPRRLFTVDQARLVLQMVVRWEDMPGYVKPVGRRKRRRLATESDVIELEEGGLDGVT